MAGAYTNRRPDIPPAPDPTSVHIHDLIWFAGLYEGEGSCYVTNKKSGRCRYVRVTLGSTDLDVVERIRSLFGGTVRPRKPQKDHWKMFYVWELTRSEEAARLLECILPYLASRRTSQVTTALEDVAEHRPYWGLAARHAANPLCPNGHPFDAVNSRGHRICSVCYKKTHRESEQRRRDRIKAAKAAAEEGLAA